MEFTDFSVFKRPGNQFNPRDQYVVWWDYPWQRVMWVFEHRENDQLTLEEWSDPAYSGTTFAAQARAAVRAYLEARKNV